MTASEVSLRNLSYSEAVRAFRGFESGDLAARSDGEGVALKFNATHAAFLRMGRDGVVVRPCFPHRPAAAQDLRPFFCGGCGGIRVGDRDEYLARFVSRADGTRLFRAVLSGDSLPSQLPDPHLLQPAFPGCEEAAAELAAGRLVGWRPLPSEEHQNA